MLKFAQGDLLIEASYTGSLNPWLTGLCSLITQKKLETISKLTLQSWKEEFGQDQFFWDLWAEAEDDIFFVPLELLWAALNKYEGMEHLYKEESPQVCRCFGVSESDIVHYLNTEKTPTLADLGVKTKAGMSCRTCRLQLERWINQGSQGKRYYKDRSFADWVILAEEQLALFPKQADWKMEIEGFKGRGIVIAYDKEVTQKEEEAMSLELQRFLADGVDPDLGFFLRSSSRQRL